MLIDRRLIQNFDWVLFFILIALSGISIINMYSATYSIKEIGGIKIFKRHICWYAIGFVIFFIVTLFDYHVFNRWSYHIYFASIFFLLLVLVIGKITSGSQRWFRLGPMSFQPSELAKISVIIIISSFFSESPGKREYGLKDLWQIFLFILVPVILILIEPDLGTSLIILIFSFTIILFSGISRKSLIAILCIGLIFAPIIWLNLKDYQKKRVLTFINPDMDPLGAGYHITQSKIAIGSGMLFGKGYLRGSQTKLHFLPEQHTDFIFSVFAEEWGFIGSLVLISLYFILILKGLEIAKNSKDRFGTYMALGITMMIFWQVFINIGMVTGILPVVGTPLLFMSYGGSSLISTMASMGILMNIRMRRYMLNGI